MTWPRIELGISSLKGRCVKPIPLPCHKASSVGIEPTTNKLAVRCSTTELWINMKSDDGNRTCTLQDYPRPSDLWYCFNKHKSSAFIVVRFTMADFSIILITMLSCKSITDFYLPVKPTELIWVSSWFSHDKSVPYENISCLSNS